MLDELMLMDGVDIPFAEATLSIHQPTLAELGYLHEDNFYSACNLLTLTKEKLNLQGKIDLSQLTNFDIIMSIMTDKNFDSQRQRVQVQMLLGLMFPDYQINFTQQGILLVKPGEKEIHSITNENYDSFKQIVEQMFCLKKGGNEGDYNPANAKARELAEKMRKGREKAAAAKGQSKVSKVAILSRYMSILAIGNQLSLNEIKQYTVWQLFDQHERFSSKMENDIYFEAKMAGAKDLKEIDNWMRDLHP